LTYIGWELKYKENILEIAYPSIFHLAVERCLLHYQIIIGKCFPLNHKRKYLLDRIFFYRNERKEINNFVVFDPIKNETRKFDRSQGQPGIIWSKGIKHPSLIKIFISRAIH
jgi:hypothetical protein